MSVKNIIPFSYFVKIVSKGVSDTFTFNRLNALVVTSPEEPKEKVIEFLSLADVAKVYGVSSKEYEYANTFFGYVSKSATMPERITFWNHNAKGSAACLMGGKIASFDTVKADGAFSLTFNGAAKDIVVNLSTTTSFSEAAKAISAAMDVLTIPAECIFDATKGGLVIRLKSVGTSFSVKFAAAPVDTTKTDLSAILCLTEETGASVVESTDSQSLAELLQEISAANGNWVSISTLDDIVPETDFKSISEWTSASAGRYVFIANDDSDALRKDNPIVYEELFGNDGLVINSCSDKNINALVQALLRQWIFLPLTVP